MHTFVDPLYRARALFADAVSMVSGEVRQVISLPDEQPIKFELVINAKVARVMA